MTRELNVKLEMARSIIRLLVRECRVDRKPADGLIRQKATPEMRSLRDLEIPEMVMYA